MPVDIYVIGFKVCGSDDGKTRDTPGYCSAIGNADADSMADQRLLKCVASAPGNYFRVSNAADLPNVFRQVAAAILGCGYVTERLPPLIPAMIVPLGVALLVLLMAHTRRMVRLWRHGFVP